MAAEIIKTIDQLAELYKISRSNIKPTEPKIKERNRSLGEH